MKFHFITRMLRTFIEILIRTEKIVSNVSDFLLIKKRCFNKGIAIAKIELALGIFDIGKFGR